jgi:protoheme IX farnesyltransferase
MLSVLLYTASDTLGLAYLITAVTLGAFFIAYAVQLFKKAGPRAAAPIYKYSLLYLAVLFVAIMIDA